MPGIHLANNAVICSDCWVVPLTVTFSLIFTFVHALILLIDIKLDVTVAVTVTVTVTVFKIWREWQYQSHNFQIHSVSGPLLG